MWRVFLAALLFASLRSPAQAQVLGMRYKLPSSSVDNYLTNCSITNGPGVRKDLERAEANAKMVENILGVTLILLTGDEGGKAEQEFIPALLSKAKAGAKLLGYWDKAQSWFTLRSPSTSFKVCEPLPGTLVVRPLKNSPLTAGLPDFSSLALRPLPVLPAQPSDLKITGLNLPACQSSAKMTNLARALETPWIAGRVVTTSSLTGLTVPISSQVVSLLSTTWTSCETGADGTFLFPNLAIGKYTLYVGLSAPKVLQVMPVTALNLGDIQ